MKVIISESAPYCAASWTTWTQELTVQVRENEAMVRFRARAPNAQKVGNSPESIQLDSVWKLCTEVLEPAHFFIAAPIILEWEYRPSETISWEIYRGRLLDSAQTRAKQTFETWNI